MPTISAGDAIPGQTYLTRGNERVTAGELIDDHGTELRRVVNAAGVHSDIALTYPLRPADEATDVLDLVGLGEPELRPKLDDLDDEALDELVQLDGRTFLLDYAARRREVNEAAADRVDRLVEEAEAAKPIETVGRQIDTAAKALAGGARTVEITIPSQSQSLQSQSQSQSQSHQVGDEVECTGCGKAVRLKPKRGDESCLVYTAHNRPGAGGFCDLSGQAPATSPSGVTVSELAKVAADPLHADVDHIVAHTEVDLLLPQAVSKADGVHIVPWRAPRCDDSLVPEGATHCSGSITVRGDDLRQAIAPRIEELHTLGIAVSVDGVWVHPPHQRQPCSTDLLIDDPGPVITDIVAASAALTPDPETTYIPPKVANALRNMEPTSGTILEHFLRDQEPVIGWDGAETQDDRIVRVKACATLAEVDALMDADDGGRAVQSAVKREADRQRKALRKAIDGTNAAEGPTARAEWLRDQLTKVTVKARPGVVAWIEAQLASAPPRLTWSKAEGSLFDWISDCGRYGVWVRARTRDGGQEWASALTSADPGDWLHSQDGSAADAKARCQAHLDSTETATAEPDPAVEAPPPKSIAEAAPPEPADVTPATELDPGPLPAGMAWFAPGDDPTVLAKGCAVCQYMVSEDDDRCPYCGHDLTQEPPDEPPAFHVQLTRVAGWRAHRMIEGAETDQLVRAHAALDRVAAGMVELGQDPVGINGLQGMIEKAMEDRTGREWTLIKGPVGVVQTGPDTAVQLCPDCEGSGECECCEGGICTHCGAADATRHVSVGGLRAVEVTDDEMEVIRRLAGQRAGTGPVPADQVTGEDIEHTNRMQAIGEAVVRHIASLGAEDDALRHATPDEVVQHIVDLTDGQSAPSGPVAFGSDDPIADLLAMVPAAKVRAQELGLRLHLMIDSGGAAR